ncbi:PhoX family phosphatase [Asticcacaulis sp. AND118]|uniref:PhoX family protein n=1 Tax=Asticcacaulis sp. AND118 TaxID=2840468 RepID=UPI001D000D82|nr:alkaline phosphatase PhoX [Asticcacaulis sp. AND118]UDF02873.1 PhoX family phosphatase [Asticcacaulis sp. AND118]
MSDSKFTGRHSDGDIEVNLSNNPSLSDVISERQSRRQMLGGMAAVAGLFGLSACGSDDDNKSAAVINAGQAGASTSGRVVTLNGSATQAASLNWTQTSGPSVTLTNATSGTPTFIAPSVATPTVLEFRLTAVDGQGRSTYQDTSVTVSPAQLGFTAVAKNKNDIVTVPEGYSVSVLYRLGDPILAGVAAYANNGTDTNFAGRAGDHHDGMAFFGLAATGTARDVNNSTRGLLVMNHENITAAYLHPNGPTTVAGARPEAEAIKEIEAHGVAIVEVTQTAGAWSYVQGGALNRRITPNTPMVLNGPARGDALLKTVYSTNGTAARGTINNCANGVNAWGTYLTCEENWAGYFRRGAGDNANRTARDVVALNRYGVSQGAGGANNWATVTAANTADQWKFSKWNTTVDTTKPADGTGDYRNEANQYGWVVEIDPYDVNSVPRKRTALGRMGHEGAWPANFVAGRKPVFYMGDDSRGEYFYKFVSATPWSAADANATDRLAIGDKYLDNGTLYVARFDATGQGVWLPLVFGTGPLTASATPYAFANQADVLINTRLAADAVGATKMDRPEWAAVNPANGEVYLTLTNNNAATRPLTGTNAANPRHYNDPVGATNNFGNPNGHIIRLREAGDNAESTTFQWDIYAFGAGADLDPTNINISGLDATNDFSSPDGLWFSRSSNAGGLVNPLLWIQTDDGAYTDVTNCMMLAAMPGRVGDGAARTLTNTGTGGVTATQATFVGKAPGMQLRRFLVGPKECEITGIDSTPDGRTLFVNIQHPGENGNAASITSNWPASQSGTTSGRPRSATIVITKTDGGVVAL